MSVPLESAGMAAIIPIWLVPTFSSLWLTMMSGPTLRAAVFSPRWLTFQFQTGAPVATVIACMAPSLPPEKSRRRPFTSAMNGFA